MFRRGLVVIKQAAGRAAVKSADNTGVKRARPSLALTRKGARKGVLEERPDCTGQRRR
jgi:hypothetical protein